MYAQDNQIRIFKGYFGFRKFWWSFRLVDQEVGHKTGIIIHFRIATSGLIDVNNCHPFEVNNQVAFAHNGIINIESTEIKSDTVIFRDEILSKLPVDFMKNSAILELIGGYAKNSKLIFLNTSGDVIIMGEKEGVWDDGIWYSNNSYKKTVNIFRYPMYASEWMNENYGSTKIRPYIHDEDICQMCGEFMLQSWEKREGICCQCLYKMGATHKDIAEFEDSAAEELNFEVEY